MSNLFRNSLILGLLFVSVIVFRFVFEAKLKTIFASIELEIKEISQKVDVSKNKKKQIENAQEELRRLREKQVKQKKVLRKEDTSTITLDYLIILRNLIDRNLKFDFSTQGTKQENGTKCNEYSISGETSLLNFKKLVYHLENQKPINTIEKITMESFSSVQSDSIHFTLTFNSYFDIGGSKSELIKIKPQKFPYSKFSIFHDGIHLPIKNEKISQNIDIQRSVLVGMTNNFILVRDKDIIQKLVPGDEVQYGVFKSINVSTKQAIFRINKIGFWENYILEFQGGTQ
ncbi:MAG: hypothetical protein K8S23_04815 [Candidatus Cloacimonetes bacterium]|nr:hypothetical protein [Candidatus Cloacimonadota bacterium]